MKALLMLTFILSVPAVHAIEADSCEVWQQKANSFMTWRQQGISIAEAMKETAGNQSRGLLLRAYAEPIEKGLEAQYQVIGDFSQAIFDECNAGRAKSGD
ncbi:MAG TPA: hypothetical protein VFM76_08400 [Methylophaga sp.]|nr:hypothetical protein [Methylophaga sp.]